VVTARPIPPGGIACAGEYSNWYYNNFNPWDPRPTQLYDVHVSGCIGRSGGTVRLEFSWSTNGYRLLDGGFRYDLRDCVTGQQLWHKSLLYERGTDSTTGSAADFAGGANRRARAGTAAAAGPERVAGWDRQASCLPQGTSAVLGLPISSPLLARPRPPSEPRAAWPRQAMARRLKVR
jgi:hypothetical protein